MVAIKSFPIASTFYYNTLLAHVLFYVLRELSLFAGTTDKAYTLNTRNLIRISLRIAACYSNHSIFIQALCLSYELPRLSVRQVGNCACVDYIYICPIFVGNDFVAFLHEFFLQSLCLILIHLTTQGVKCYFNTHA